MGSIRLIPIVTGFPSVQEASPPIVLVFGPFDPTGSAFLPADAITCAALGGHAISAVTALHIQDTANVEDVQDISPDIIDDQARCLLEDMSVRAIKAGPLYTTDAVRVLAQIAADYADVPLVVHLAGVPQIFASNEHDLEEVNAALCELLLPQTDLVIIEDSLLSQWGNDGVLPGRGAGHLADTLRSFGTPWVLTTGETLRPGHRAYVLRGPDQQVFNWAWHAPQARTANLDGPLACALTIALGQGKALPGAAEDAIKATVKLTARTFRPGMGSRLINRTAP